MKAASVIISLAMLSFINAALAQPAGDDRKTIQTCLASQDGNLGSKCVGIIADPCIEAASGDGTKAKACATRELVVWEAQMEAALKRVKAGGFKDIGRAVTQAQATWQSSLRELCPIFDKIDPGMLPGAAQYCRMYETAHRALLLRRLGDAVNEH
jgi:hypothetical protein